MKQTSFLQNRQTSFLTAGLLVAAVVIGMAGIRHQGGSSAASVNPYGTLDYCVLSGSTTVIYGWAADPQVTTASTAPNLSIKVGATSVNVPTNSTTYRTAAITNYIKQHHAGDPTPGEYGFTAQFTGLYKGGSYPISGTVLNYGAGANVAANDNQTSLIDGVNRNVFTGGKIPDACLAPKPVPPAPTPVPTPTPTPTPIKTPVRTPVRVTPAAPVATASAAADGTATAGTLTATIQVPAGNATTIHLTYGIDGGVDQVTPDQTTNNATTPVVLTGLSAKTKYHYQIVRLLNGQTVTSPPASFTTSGYVISLVLTANHKPVSGITGELNDAKATSDKAGKLTFKDVDEGSYSVNFSYKGHTYSQAVSTDTVITSADPTPVSIDVPVNLDDLQLAASSGHGMVGQKQSSSAAPIIIVVVTVIALLGGGAWFFLRRRRSAEANTYPSGAAATVPVNPMVAGDILDKHSHRLSKKQAPAEPLPEHAGKSLRDLVVESMRAEAGRRKGNSDPPPPHVPGGK